MMRPPPTSPLSPPPPLSRSVGLPFGGPPRVLWVMVRVPGRPPATVGVNVTLIVQVFDPAVAGKVVGLIGQAVAPVLVSAKSPDAAMELIVSAAFPVFVSVTVCAALVVLIN